MVAIDPRSTRRKHINFKLNIPSIARGLVQARWDVLAAALCLDRPHARSIDEQCVVDRTGLCRPFRDRHVPPVFRPRTFRISHRGTVDLPPDEAELFIN